MLGGLLGAVANRIIMGAHGSSPVMILEDTGHFLAGEVPITSFFYKSFSAVISEAVGAFMFVFLVMLSTDKKT